MLLLLQPRARAEAEAPRRRPHRRLGRGRELLLAAIERAPGLGLHTLLGYIFGHNEPSLRLFAAHDFVRWGHLPRVAVLDGVARDLIIVGRRIIP
jgi:phosphinothricin acetyltransferase